jgi:hypothetical protein
MNISVRFRQVVQSTDMFELIENEARRLERRHPQVVGCHVVIDKPNHRHQKGNPIRVQLTVSLRGKPLVFSKLTDGRDELGNAMASLSHSFDAAEHAIDLYLHRQRSLFDKSRGFQYTAV